MSVLYLHVGTRKTGTTAIQHFCNVNQEALLQKGFAYPIFKYKYTNGKQERNAKFMADLCYDEEGKRDKDREERRWQKSSAEIVEIFRSGVKGVILSDEAIWDEAKIRHNTHWENLKELGDANDFEVKIIVYFRPQEEFLLSWWKQRIKQKDGKKVTRVKWNLKTVAKSIELDYYKNLERFAKVFGKENIIVRIYDHKLFEGKGHTIQSDFLNIMGIEMDDSFELSTERDNTSLSGNIPEIKRLINNLPDFNNETGDEIRDSALAASACSTEYEYTMFSPEERKKFNESYAESNARVAREYLGREDGILFEKKPKDLPQWTPDNPYMYADIIRYFGEAQLRMVLKVKDLQKQVREQDAQIRALESRVKKAEEVSDVRRLARKVKHKFKQVKKQSV